MPLIDELSPEYSNLVYKAPDCLCGIQRMIFTWGMFVGLKHYTYDFRYCFRTLVEAEGALRDFDLSTDPEGFIVRKGLGDDYNPNDQFNQGIALEKTGYY